VAKREGAVTVVTFGERLRRLRREAGLSQGQLAGEGLSTSYISLLESGKRTPSPEVVRLLTARLGCSTTQLMEGRPSDRDQLISLELAYAKLAIEHGESADAKTRLERLLQQDGLPFKVKDEVALLLGTALERLGDHVAAVRVLRPVYERATTAQSEVSIILVALVLCRAYLDSGDLNRAAQAGEVALAAAREQKLNGTNEYFRLAATVMYAYTEIGDLIHARTWADSLISEAKEAGEVAGQAVLYWNSAVVAELEGRMGEALHLCEQAMGHLSELDNLRDYARVRLFTAEIMLTDDPPDVNRAGMILDAALSDLRDLGSRVDLGGWNRAKAIVNLLEGDFPAGEGLARQAIELLADSKPGELALAWMTLHDTLTPQGRLEEAADCRDHAYEDLASAKNGRVSSFLWRELGERFMEHGESDRAIDAYRRALTAAGVRDRSRAVRSASAENRAARTLSG
jgi:transcriptional regulator with XRE-family HTH domain